MKKDIFIDWKLFLFTFPFTLPAYLYNITEAKVVAFIIAAVACIFIIMKLLKLKTVSHVLVSIITLHLIYLVSTLVNEYTDVSRWVLVTVPVVAVLTLLEIYVREGKFVVSIKTLTVLFSLYNVLNCISMIVFPNGLYDARGIGEFGYTIFGNTTTSFYFLGFQKGHIFTQLGACMISYLNDAIKSCNLSLLTILNILVSLFSNIVQMSVSGSFAIITLICILLIKNIVDYKLSLIKCIILVYSVWLLVVVCRIQDIFTPILELVGKDISMTGRTVIWDVGINYWLNNPLLGVGIISNEHSYDIFHFGVGSVHSLFLEVLFYGGLIAFICFSDVLWRSFRNVSILQRLDKKMAFVSVLFIILNLVLYLFNSGQQKLILYISLAIPHYINYYLIGKEKND